MHSDVMRAVVITEPGQLGVVEVPRPEPGPEDVLIKVSSVGICGTDLHILDGHYAPSLPIIPGHEFAGVAVAVGDSVSGVRPGDLITADPNIYCGKCIRCRSGRDNLCLNASAIGVNLPGAMAEYVVAPAANCVILPERAEVQDASLVEPLSCAVHAFDTLNARIGQHVLIYGAGPMGLVLTTFAERALAASVSVVDLNQERLSWATRAGAGQVGTSADQLNTLEFDVVIDCTGAPPAIEDGIARLAPGGTFVQFGVSHPDARVSISPERLLMAELKLVGSRAVHQSFERAAAIFATGAIDPELVISDRFGLDDAELAFSRFRSGQGRKIQIVPGGVS